MAVPTQKSALDAVRLFRMKEFTGLSKHLRKFGPLPEPPVSSSNAAPAGTVTLPNPFLPKKHPNMRKWLAPKYSLRRQAELVKKAQASGTMDLLPPGPKKFAAELRAERVKASLPLAQRELEEKLEALKIQVQDATADLNKEKRELEKRVSALGSSLGSLRVVLKGATAEYDVGQLESFEAGSSEVLTAEQVLERREAQQKRAKNKLLIETRVKKTEDMLAKAKQKLAKMARAEKKSENTTWKQPVVWAGAFKADKTPGSELGTRLYSGKRRMFKGHLWERQQARRARRHTILMRDMPARLERYKNYYKKRRPNPLKPSRYTKPPKLPF